MVRWLIASKKLSREQRRVLEGAVRRMEPVGVSAISLLEIAVLVSEGKLRLKGTLEEFFEELQGSPVFRVVPLTAEIASDVAGLGQSSARPGRPCDRLDGTGAPTAAGNVGSADY